MTPENRVAQLEAAMLAYASEFPLNEGGGPDVANIHATIREMKSNLLDYLAMILDAKEVMHAAGITHDCFHNMFKEFTEMKVTK